MAIDASIYNAVPRPEAFDPLTAMAKQEQLASARNQNRLTDLAYSEKQRDVAGDNALARLLSQGLKSEDVATGLASQGYGGKSMAYTKSQQDAAKVKSETDAKNFETASKRTEAMGQALGWLKDNPTPDNAVKTVQYLVENGIMPPDKAQSAISQFQADPTPQGIAKFAMLGYQASLKAKDQLAQFQTRNTGGTTDTLSINPVTGQVAVANSVKNTQSPDSIASNATAQRGQNMTDARARETASMALSKPFEITGEDGKPVLVQQDKQGNIKPVQGYTPKQGASKPLTDTQAKALQFGSRMQESEDIIGQLAAKGTEQPGLIKRGADLIGAGAAANWTQSAPQQQVEQAQRNFINAALRRESGAAIADSEFANAKQQYFPQPGDSAAVIAQKAANRQQATRGILAEVPDSENRVAKVRAKPAAPNIDALLDKYK